MRKFPIELGPLTKLFLSLAPKFRWLSAIFLKTNPTLERWMAQGGMDIDPEDYIFVAFATSVFFAIMIGSIFILMIILVEASFYKSLPILLAATIAPAAFSWINFITYPRRIVVTRGREIEKKLVYGLREMVIELKSGIPLYDAIKNIARGEYGGLSDEFKRIVRDVEAGTPLELALEASALRVESKYYRSALWAMISALRAGTDVSEALDEIVKALTEEQKIAIKQYAQSLNPMILMYMMTSVIFPILGITMLIIIGSMGGITVGRNVFMMIWFVVFIMQIVFISTIKAKRPPVIG